MKKLFLLCLFTLNILAFGQMQHNPFGEGERSTENAPNRYEQRDLGDDTGLSPQDGDPGGGPGNPGGVDDLPIDDYLPLLAVIGIALLIYKTRQKKNLLF